MTNIGTLFYSTPESVLDFGSERGSEKEQWQTWSRKAPNFDWATSGWVNCSIDSFWQASANQVHIALSEPMSYIDQQGSSLGSCPTSPPLILTLMGLRAFDLVSSLIWWEALANTRHAFYSVTLSGVWVTFRQAVSCWPFRTGVAQHWTYLWPQGAVPPGFNPPRRG